MTKAHIIADDHFISENFRVTYVLVVGMLALYTQIDIFILTSQYSRKFGIYALIKENLTFPVFAII